MDSSSNEDENQHQDSQHSSSHELTSFQLQPSPHSPIPSEFLLNRGSPHTPARVPENQLRSIASEPQPRPRLSSHLQGTSARPSQSMFQPTDNPFTTPSFGIDDDGSHEASIDNTPYNAGSASHTRHEIQTTHKDFEPFLKVDIEHEKPVQLDQYTSKVLHTDNITSQDRSALNDIAGSAKFHELLAAYTRKMSDEPERYPPFVELFNWAIAQMKAKGLTDNELDIVLCIADPMPIRGSKTERKPDAIGVKALTLYMRTAKGRAAYGKVQKASANAKGKEKALVINYDEVYRVAKRPPTKDSPFIYMWDDVLFFIELKMHSQAIQQALAPPKDASKSKNKGKGKGKQSQTPQAPPRDVRRSARLGGSKSTTSTVASGSHDPEPSRSTEPVPPSIASSGVKRSRDQVESTSEVATGLLKRRKVADIPLKYRLQCASYALEMFNRGGLRTHVIGTLIVDDEFYIFLYTRSGSCRTSKFSFVNDPHTFLCVLLAFSRMTLEDWGIVPQIQACRLSHPSPALSPHVIDRFIFSKQSFTINGTEYVLEEVLIFPRGLLSRGTWVIRATCARHAVVAMKFSALPVSRVGEWTVVKKAVDTANANPGQHAWVLNRLPRIHDGGDIDMPSFAELFGEDYEKRGLRFLVSEFLIPITKLTDSNEMALAFKDTVECHQWLVQFPRILHRDISVNNLMCRRVGDQIYGVLNDFDLACFIDDHKSPTSKHRTGTKPFIATDLLSPVSSDPTGQKHYVRYDLESFLYVFAWIIGRFEDGKEIENPPYEKWSQGEWEDVRQVKNDWFTRPMDQVATRGYAPLRMVLRALVKQFKSGRDEYYVALDDKESNGGELRTADGELFDEATLDGKVTYTTFLSAFKDIPDPRRT
ncbi:hypothetical protein VNI00_011538 [Paramarasmius palmivorus]|uniref:Fungal-type protein kinase domain-containing protein n=1 Tax=Paramarasmius palmivorus TaxID=297713 RepID=A0AAW0CCY1_9AGAR